MGDIKNKVAEVVEKVAKNETATKATPIEIIVDKEKKAVSDKKSILVEPLLVEEKISESNTKRNIEEVEVLSSLNKQPEPVELDSSPVQIPSKSKLVSQIFSESESAVAIIDTKGPTVPQIPSLPPTTQTVEKPPKKLSSKT